MSRSYYKYPSFKDYSRNHTRWAKRQASKAVRRDWNIGNGSDYKKVYCRYNIFDYRWTYYTNQEILDSWYAEEDKLYKVKNRSLANDFDRESIRFFDKEN